MSKKNNVNPDFYKVGGRDRPSQIARDREEAGRRKARPGPPSRGQEQLPRRPRTDAAVRASKPVPEEARPTPARKKGAVGKRKG